MSAKALIVKLIKKSLQAKQDVDEIKLEAFLTCIWTVTPGKMMRLIFHNLVHHYHHYNQHHGHTSTLYWYISTNNRLITIQIEHTR